MLTTKTLTASGVGTALLAGAMMIVAVNYASPNGSVTKLHYTIYFGTDLLGPWWYLLIYPLGLVVSWGVHLFCLPVLGLTNRRYLLLWHLAMTAILICGFFWSLILNIS